MFTCPSCHLECKKLVENIYEHVLGCENCNEPNIFRSSNLHDIVAQHGEVKVTAGKAWEIRNRTKSKDDGHTIINRITGRPTQF